MIDFEDFFRKYGDALVSRDVKAIAALWCTPSLAILAKGSVAMTETAHVEEFFAAGLKQIPAMASAKVVLTSTAELRRDLVACTVRWEHLDDAGRSVGNEIGYYILRRSGEDWTVQVFVPNAGSE